jgi:hypothetical protein
VESCGRRVNTGSWRVPARLLAQQVPRACTARHRQAAGASPDLLPDIVSGTGSTGFEEDLVRPEAEAAADDPFLDLGGAAEDRRDVTEPPELTIAPESSGLVLPPVKAGSIWPARAAAFARCDLGGDHAPGDRLAAWQRPEPRRGPTTTPNQRPRISQPPMRTSTPVSSSRHSVGLVCRAPDRYSGRCDVGVHPE